MEALLVFIPNTTFHQPPGYLNGYFRQDSNKHCSVYIIGTDLNDDLLNNHGDNVVGYYSSDLGSVFHNDSNEHSDWITITRFGKKILIDSCVINNKVQSIRNSLLIIYDINSLLKSELLLLPSSKSKNEINHFKVLANDLQLQKGQQLGFGYNVIFKIIGAIVKPFSVVNIILRKFAYITKYSTLASHLENYCHTILWIRNTYHDKKFVSLKLGNCLISIVTDILLGLLLFYYITSWKSADQIFDLILSCTENVISSISHVVNWLMGSPAGLKLNQPLNSLFGSLVLYYLEIWWSFLNLVRPVLEIAFQLFIKIGFLGLTFQLSVCADIFAVISFHVYCIYVYAARLYEIQAKGIYSLSRLFLGRKRNPEPGKVDSCPYSTEELLIGTISFAVLLFLLPTTLVYYIVFTVMRLGVKIIRGLMTRTIYFLQTLPIYLTFLWIFFPANTATTVKLTPSNSISGVSHGCLTAKPASSSWMDTINLCRPDIILSPVPIKFGEAMWKIIIGKLI